MKNVKSVFSKLSRNQVRHFNERVYLHYDENKEIRDASGLERRCNGIYMRLYVRGLGPNSLGCVWATSIRLDSLNDGWDQQLRPVSVGAHWQGVTCDLVTEIESDRYQSLLPSLEIKMVPWMLSDMCVREIILDYLECFLPLILLNAAVLLHGRRWKPSACGTADLPEASERHSQAELHLHLPELHRLVRSDEPRPPACRTVPRQQRRGDDASQIPLYHITVWWLSGKMTSRWSLFL